MRKECAFSSISLLLYLSYCSHSFAAFAWCSLFWKQRSLEWFMHPWLTKKNIICLRLCCHVISRKRYESNASDFGRSEGPFGCLPRGPFSEENLSFWLYQQVLHHAVKRLELETFKSQATLSHRSLTSTLGWSTDNQARKSHSWWFLCTLKQIMSLKLRLTLKLNKYIAAEWKPLCEWVFITFWSVGKVEERASKKFWTWRRWLQKNVYISRFGQTTDRNTVFF